MRTAIRRGWLDDVPQADRDALVVRFNEATNARRGDDPDGHNTRAMMAEIAAAFALEHANHRDAMRELRYAMAWRPTGQTNGRPRERWHVSDYVNRIDAHELRRCAKADGVDLSTLNAINVRRGDDSSGHGERVGLAVAFDARFGWRIWLVCPCCGSRRTHLYPPRGGICCRRWGGGGYGGNKYAIMRSTSVSRFSR